MLMHIIDPSCFQNDTPHIHPFLTLPSIYRMKLQSSLVEGGETMGTMINSRLKLMFQTGVDEFGEPTFRSKTYANIQPNASDERLANAAIALASLSSHNHVETTRHNTILL